MYQQKLALESQLSAQHVETARLLQGQLCEIREQLDAFRGKFAGGMAEIDATGYAREINQKIELLSQRRTSELESAGAIAQTCRCVQEKMQQLEALRQIILDYQ